MGQTGAKDGTETDWAKILPFGGSDAEQIAFLIQVHTRAFAAGVERVIWGDFFIEGGSDLMMKRGMPTGLFYTESWNRKPAYYTYRLLAAVLRDFTTVERLGEKAYRFQFASRRPVYVLWP